MGMRYCGGSKTDSQVNSYYCTFIGAICVATNPFAPQKAWKNTFKIEDYLASEVPVMENKKLQPHPWAVADMAYNEMLNEGKNQAVLICGESGAGKTECCKFVLAYLIAKKETTVEKLDDKLMATNDPLEAFGNAKTVNNDNSSRFAKCMQICLDAEGRVIGAEIQTSLLEKGRSCAFFQQERNFHILYMLPYYRFEGGCLGEDGEDTNTDDAQDMLGDKAYEHMLPADQFECIRPGDDEVDTTGLRYRDRFRAGDIDWFKRVIRSFRDALGYTKKDTDEMMALLAACLHMGNITFEDKDASEVTPDTLKHVKVVADCFQMDADELAAEIVKERLMMGGSLISKELNKVKAMSSRDAIVKSIFQTIFTDIVERCNISVCGEKERAKGRVGVLDIFGFERMQFNSLEQVCINYTNEKLHQCFINEVFETEKKVYSDEGLDPSAINFTDNAKVLEMVTGCNPHDTSGKSGVNAAEIKKKIKISLFGILDDVCKQEKNNGVTYCERVMKQWKGAADANGPLFIGPKFGAEEFEVVHFAGPVKYGTTEVDKGKFLPPSMWEKNGISPSCPQIDSFLTKNKDKVPQSLLDFFTENSKNDYYLYINRADRDGTVVGSASGAGSSGASAAKTTVSKFNLEIEAFFKQLLTGANPKFIRAINPRPKGIPAPKTMGERFNLQRVLSQLICTGILDTVRVRASGYIIRKKYEDFAHTYIHPCNLLGNDGDHPLQAGMDDLEFANKLKEDANLSKECIRALFGTADYSVPQDEVLEGRTMIFIKKLTTIGGINKRKEDMMVEVIKREKAKMAIAALTLKWMRLQHFEKMEKAASKLQASYRMWLSIYGPTAKKGMWARQIALARVYATAVPFAEAWARGALCRRGGGGEAGFEGKTEEEVEELKKKREEYSIEMGRCGNRQQVKQVAVLADHVAQVEAAVAAGEEPPPLPANAGWAAKKQAAIADGKWQAGGGGLLKERKKKVKAEVAIDFSKFAKVADSPAQQAKQAAAQAQHVAQVEAAEAAGKPPPKPPVFLTGANIGQALGAGAGAAAAAAPKSTNIYIIGGFDSDGEKVAPMSTRRYIDSKLQVSLVKAVKALHKYRPDTGQMQNFLLTAMDPATTLDMLEAIAPATKTDENEKIYKYLKGNKAFDLLKPALLAVDKHRPEDPQAYMAAFMQTAVETAEELAD